MVVSGDSLASRVGAEILRSGGNAVDAAVAVGFALAVTFPEAGNLGGGGFMTIWIPDSGGATIDFRERAPAASTPVMFGEDTASSVDGCLAAGVPGTVAGLLLALERFGTLPRSTALQPAIDLARNGFGMNGRLHSMLQTYGESLRKYPSTVRTWFPGGAPPAPGTILRQEDLAGTLERIRDEGKSGFYGGSTAELIERQMKAGGGIMTAADLASYEAGIHQPLRGSYRGYEFITMGLPSSGGICISTILRLLEPYDLKAAGHNSVRAVHLTTEAMKRAFAMRAGYLGDPDFSPVPVRELLAPDSPGTRLPGILEEEATPVESLTRYPYLRREGSETTHYSVIDKNGMAVAVTYTLNDLFGNKVVVDGAGFFLNDEMDDFVTIPGVPNLYGLVGGEENMVQPGKRPLSSMCPMIVLKDGSPVLILGARGGSRIISGILQVMLNIIDFGMPVTEAVRAPRFHHQWLPDRLVYEEGAFTPGTVAGLGAMGHLLAQTTGTVGQLEVVYIDTLSGWYYGVPDPREGGSAAGF